MWKGYRRHVIYGTAKKIIFPIKDFFSKCYQIHSKLRIWAHLLKKSVMENFLLFVRYEITVATRSNFFHGISLGDDNAFSVSVYIENISHLPEVIFTIPLMVGIVNLCF